MKINKKLISVLLTFILIINTTFCVLAEVNPDTPLGKAIRARNNIVELIDNSESITGTILDGYLKAMSEPIGFIVGANVFTGEVLANMFRGKTIGNTTIPNNTTDDEVIQTVGELLTTNITQENDTLIYNNNAKTILSIYREGVEDYSPFHYTLGYNVQSTASQFIDTTHYNKTIEILSVSDNTINLFGISNNKWTICKAKRNNVGFVLRSSQWAKEESIYLYDIDDKSALYSSDVDYFDIWEYDTNNSNYIKVEGMYAFPNIFVQKPGITGTQAGYVNGQGYVVGYNYEPKIKVFNTNSDISSLAPYYVNSGIFDSVMNSNNTYTLTEDNSNNITYGDINNYNNNNDPNDNNIQIFIDNNIPPSSGGGSGGGGTGGGGTGGIGDIFGWLTQIGKVLGNLIKNVGQVLADIVEGIAEVVNDLIESIPTVFGDFMGALLGWLPVELRALITLSITAMIIVGLIKLFRG